MAQQMRRPATGAWEYDLLAAIIQRAILDATSCGERAEQAAEWLDDVAPEWRELDARQARRPPKRAHGRQFC